MPVSSNNYYKQCYEITFTKSKVVFQSNVLNIIETITSHYASISVLPGKLNHPQCLKQRKLIAKGVEKLRRTGHGKTTPELKQQDATATLRMEE